jgi:hypothetical protein
LGYSRGSVPTFAQAVRSKYHIGEQTPAPSQKAPTVLPQMVPAGTERDEAEKPDAKKFHEDRAIEAFRKHPVYAQLHEGREVPWGRISKILEEALPDTMENREQEAHNLVRKALTTLFGPEPQGWLGFRHPERKTTYIKLGR